MVKPQTHILNCKHEDIFIGVSFGHDWSATRCVLRRRGRRFKMSICETVKALIRYHALSYYGETKRTVAMVADRL